MNGTWGERDLSLWEGVDTDKQGEEARMIHAVMDYSRRHHSELCLV